jgi:hypothetical protein
VGDSGSADGVGVAVATAVSLLSEAPQCMQNAAPGFTTPLQRGHTLCALFSPSMLPAGFTGVPHSGQNFLPVTSRPQDVQDAMVLSPYEQANGHLM